MIATRTLLPALVTFFVATPALAASDLEVSISSPGAVSVYDTSNYEVVVDNVGNRNARNVQLTIELPATSTSPQVYVLGDLGSIDGRCTQVGTSLQCNLGKVRKNRSKSVSFEIDLPWSAEDLDVTASASTSSKENSTSNNDASDTATQLYFSTAIADGDVAHNRHCTGQSLTSFFECELFPSSISSHDIQFNGDGSITFLGGVTGFNGQWQQLSSDSLEFSYSQNGQVVAEFEGYGTAPGCFEGLTTFPGSAYMAPYEVCL